MHWLRGIGIAIRNDLVRAQMGGHHVESAWFETAADSAGDICHHRIEFANEMRRFLPPYTVVRMIDKPLSMEIIAGKTERLICMAHR